MHQIHGIEERGMAAREILRGLLADNGTSRRSKEEAGSAWKCVQLPHDGSDLVSTCCLTGNVMQDAQRTPHLGISCLPTVIIAGFQKTGTTALASMLAERLHVRFPRQKEVHYFDKNLSFRKGLGWYVNQFPQWHFSFHDWQDPPVYAEATPFYLSSPTACSRIARSLPDTKIIAVVREPAARAYSEWQMKKRRVEAQDAFVSLFMEHHDAVYNCLKEYAYDTKGIFWCLPSALREDVHWSRFYKAFNDERLKSSTDWFVSLDTCFGLNSILPASKAPPPAPAADALATEATPTQSVSLMEFNDTDILQLMDEGIVRDAAESLYGVNSAPLAQSQRLSDYESSFRKTATEGSNATTLTPASLGIIPCLLKVTGERLAPFRETIEEEMSVLSKCADTNATSDMPLRQFRAHLERCVRVKQGISGQYMYRSLYAAQLDKCSDDVSPNNMLTLVSEHMDRDMGATLRNVSSFLGLNKAMESIEAVRAAAVTVDDAVVEESVSKHFPKFEEQTGWRLRSEYAPLATETRQAMQRFFRLSNQLLYDQLGLDLEMEWVGEGYDDDADS